jgi:hypothetical protein
LSDYYFKFDQSPLYSGLLVVVCLLPRIQP